MKAMQSQLQFTENQFRGVYGGIGNYEQYCKSTEFVHHCEVSLIKQLTENHLPTVIGISKACCPLCYQFIKILNDRNRSEKKGIWIIGQKHDKFYQWDYEDDVSDEMKYALDGVRMWVEKKVMQMIECCQMKAVTESPSHVSESEDLDRVDGDFW